MSQKHSSSKNSLDVSISVLVDAKTEYTRQLIDMLRTPLLKGIISIYNEAKELCMENNKKPLILKTFQNMLSCVPKWTQEILDDECKRIVDESQCDWLDDLLTAIFISHTKILTSVRTTNKNKKINLQIPRTDVFVHKTYIELARAFWSSPYLLDDVTVSSLEYQKNLKESEKIVEEGIESTIRKLVPVQEILKKYLSENNEEDDVESVNSEEEEEVVEEKTNKKKHKGGGNEEQAVEEKEETNPLSPQQVEEEPLPFAVGGGEDTFGTEMNLDFLNNSTDTVDISFQGMNTESTYQPPAQLQQQTPPVIPQDVLNEIENFHLKNGGGSPLPMMDIPASPPPPQPESFVTIPSPPVQVVAPSPMQINGMTSLNLNGLTASSPVQLGGMTSIDLGNLGGSPPPQSQPRIQTDPKNFNFF